MAAKPTTSLPSIVAEMRERTARAHAALEASDLVMPATRNRARYAQLIGAMLSFHRCIEAQFRTFETAMRSRGVEMNGRYKAHLLEAESIVVCGHAASEPEVTFASAHEAMGGLYVMEGSTLGGMLIARSVSGHLAIESRYYGCYGEATALQWREMKAQLDAAPATREERDAMCRGAEATFMALRAHLERARSG